MSKTVAIKMPSAPATTADAWVRRSAGEEVAEPMKRFTIDVTENLHKRIKARCAMKGAKMADVIRALLEQEFPESENWKS